MLKRSLYVNGVLTMVLADPKDSLATGRMNEVELLLEDK